MKISNDRQIAPFHIAAIERRKHLRRARFWRADALWSHVGRSSSAVSGTRHTRPRLKARNSPRLLWPLTVSRCNCKRVAA